MRSHVDGQAPPVLHSDCNWLTTPARERMRACVRARQETERKRERGRRKQERQRDMEVVPRAEIAGLAHLDKVLERRLMFAPVINLRHSTV